MAVHEVRIQHKNPADDFVGRGLEAEIAVSMGLAIPVRTSKLYYLDTDLAGAQTLAKEVLREPITQRYRLNGSTPTDPLTLRVGYQPGVMNPEVGSILDVAQDLGVQLSAADTVMEYKFPKGTDLEVAYDVMNRFVTSPIVHRRISGRLTDLNVVGDADDGVLPNNIIAERYDEGYLRNTAWRYGFSDFDEFVAVREHFTELGRDPTRAELMAIAGWWSEHCSHKTFRSEIEFEGEILKPLLTQVREVAEMYMDDDTLSAYEGNAGAIRFYEETALVMKVETHNHPSAIEPKGGAETGVGGGLRDDIDMEKGGTKIILTGNILCFGPWTTPNEDVLDGCLHPAFIQRKVVEGIADYGNKFGTPTADCTIHYHKDFSPKPNVMLMAIGIMPEANTKRDELKKGDLVILMGGRTGNDGIGGATGSSRLMTENSMKVYSQTVQIGNPIEEKKVHDASIEIGKKNLAKARNDCGAAGLSSGVGEIAKGIGVTIDLAKVPRKYRGMRRGENVLLSESQERSIVVIDPSDIDEVTRICKLYEVEATVIGHLDGSNKFNVMDSTYSNSGDRFVAELDYEFLEHGRPKKILKASWEKPVFDDSEPETPPDWVDSIKKVLGHGNVCSKQPIINRYDHGVQGKIVGHPFSGVEYDGPNDGVVLTPFLDKPYGVVEAHGLNPILNRIHPYWGTIWAFTESVANYVAVGGDPKTAMYSENFVSPATREQYLGSLVLQVRAIVDFMHATKRYVGTGKDSLGGTYRDYRKDITVEIPPVTAFTTLGKIPDARKTTSSDIKDMGSTLVLVGKLDDQMGGSVFYDTHGLVGNEVPKVDLTLQPKVFATMHEAIKNGDVKACHDVGEGGVITTIAEMCFGGDCGADIDVNFALDKPERFIFNETAGAFVVEVADEETAKNLFGAVPFTVLGKTQADKNLQFKVQGNPLFTASVDELKRAWKAPLEGVFGK